MRTAAIDEKRKCPKCGYNISGTQRCKCKSCNILYTVDPRPYEYSEDIKEQAIKPMNIFVMCMTKMTHLPLNV